MTQIRLGFFGGELELVRANKLGFGLTIIRLRACSNEQTNKQGSKK